MRRELQQKWTHFDSLDTAEKQRMRALHRQLTARPDAPRLFAMLAQYRDWLATLTPGERVELAGLTPQERVPRIVQMKRRQEEQAFLRRLKSPLGRDDAEALFAWIDDYLERHQAEIARRLAPRHRELLADSPLGRRRMMLLRALQRNGRGRLARPTAQTLQQLSDQLSPDARLLLDLAESPQEKLETLRRWIQVAMESRGGPRPPKREELQDYFESLSDADRRELERLAPERFKRELMRKFMNL